MTPTEDTPSRTESCPADETSPEILDLVASLPAARNGLGARLHPGSASALAACVRIMNCCYSNLIEGHNTTPTGDVDTQPTDRNRRPRSLRFLQ
jgi:hypothetical protein